LLNKLYHFKYYLIIDENLHNQYKAIIDAIIKKISSVTIINGNMEVAVNDITINIYGDGLDFPADINWVYDSIIYFKKYDINAAQYRTTNNQFINVIYNGTRYIKSKEYTHEYYVNNTLRKEYKYDTSSNSKRTNENHTRGIDFYATTITGWGKTT
jgi:hypothetical protein